MNRCTMRTSRKKTLNFRFCPTCCSLELDSGRYVETSQSSIRGTQEKGSIPNPSVLRKRDSYSVLGANPCYALQRPPLSTFAMFGNLLFTPQAA